MSRQRFALIIASDSYTDTKLTQLNAPRVDAKRLEKLLKNPPIGDGYDVKLIENKEAHIIRQEIERFFKSAAKDDLRLLYFAGHGHKSMEDGRLYLATTDSDLEVYEATTIPADFIKSQMQRSKSSQIVVILDCCYSGAFLRGVLARADDKALDLRGQFEELESKNTENGCVVLTSANAMQFSWEGDVLKREEQAPSETSSFYTNLLIKGIESMEADIDGDGKIGCKEMHEFILNEMRKNGHPQKPDICLLKGDVTIAYSKKDKKVFQKETIPESPLVDIDYLSKLGYARFNERKYDLALGAFEQILKAKPHDLNALFWKGKCLRYLRRLKESLSLFDEALIIAQKDPTILMEKAYTWRQLGEHSKAYRTFEEIIWGFDADSKLPPFKPFTLFNRNRDNPILTVAKYNHKELEDILFHPNKALSYWLDKAEKNDILMGRHVITYYGKDKEQILQSDREKISGDIESLNNVSHLLYKLGKGDQAEKYLRRALALYPDDVYALNVAHEILQFAKINYSQVKDKKDDKSIKAAAKHKLDIQTMERILTNIPNRNAVPSKKRSPI